MSPQLARSIYHAEKRRAIRRGALVLTEKRQPRPVEPKRDQREANAAYFQKNKERLAQRKRELRAAQRAKKNVA